MAKKKPAKKPATQKRRAPKPKPDPEPVEKGPDFTSPVTTKPLNHYRVHCVDDPTLVDLDGYAVDEPEAISLAILKHGKHAEGHRYEAKRIDD